jgi:diaminopimelate epimerase
MEYTFYKYQGAGNDFILIDNREKTFPVNDIQLYKQLCDRRFGIGADGLMLLENEPGYDFKMVYFNSDGRESSMCGNGGRCIVRFAEYLGIVKSECRFLAVDGQHYAKISDKTIELQMIDVSNWKLLNTDYEIYTGSPHYIKWVNELSKLDVFSEGRNIRYNNVYNADGINVNFIEETLNGINVRTYERGVEDETLSCGTGVTACAMAFALKHNRTGEQSVDINTPGGKLKVQFNIDSNGFNHVFLIGPAEKVFQGLINV